VSPVDLSSSFDEQAVAAQAADRATQDAINKIRFMQYLL
jgi:hypothetical protein